MYVTVTWTPLNGTSTTAISNDIAHALDPSDFALPYEPYKGLYMAAVRGNNLQHVRDLAQTLFPLAQQRFDYVIAYVPKGHYMYVSGPNVSLARCDALTKF